MERFFNTLHQISWYQQKYNILDLGTRNNIYGIISQKFRSSIRKVTSHRAEHSSRRKFANYSKRRKVAAKIFETDQRRGSGDPEYFVFHFFSTPTSSPPPVVSPKLFKKRAEKKWGWGWERRILLGIISEGLFLKSQLQEKYSKSKSLNLTKNVRVHQNLFIVLQYN